MSSSTQQSQQQQQVSYQYEKELNYCINIAIEAGIIAMEFCNNRVQLTTTGTTDLASTLGIEQKLDDSPVTLVDKKLDALIKQKLEIQFPDCLVVGEESSASIESTQKLEQGKVFFVDPIDGTKEFISNNGEWCVMIGLNIDGRPELGVVYVASRDQLFYASRGNGSFVMEGLVTLHVGGGGEPHWIKNSEQRVSLSRQLFSNQYTDASQMVCLRSRSHDEAEITSVMNELKMDKAMCSGSFGIKCALIAEGKADLYINASKKTHYWDSCAPSVIATEAGAVLLDMDGNELQYTGVATNTVHTVVMFATLKPLKEQVMRAVQKVYASRR